MKTSGRLGAHLRDVWVAFGLALVAFFVLECSYRGQRWLRGQLRGDDPASSVQHPYAGRSWWAEFGEFEADRAANGSRYDTHLGYRLRPYSSPLLNIDSAGHRITIQPNPAPPVQRVLILGGSSVFGVTARDDSTIPSLTAAHLARRGISTAEVVNLGVAGYNRTQEAISLLLELAHDRRPAAVVFVDGFNDVIHGRRVGVPGQSGHEARIQYLIDLGRRGLWRELAGLGRHSELVVRLLGGQTDGAARPDSGSKDRVCGPVAGYYRRTADAVEALARGEGFAVWFLQQPMHATSAKVLTPWERSLPAGSAVRRCLASIDSAMVDRRGVTYLSLASLFDRDTATVFTDQFAHVTEAGNDRIAGCIAALIAPALEPSASRPAAPNRVPTECQAAPP